MAAACSVAFGCTARVQRPDRGLCAGIGNVRSGLHPVQDVLAKSHGSQCGFCTPGFVMSMYSLLRYRHTVQDGGSGQAPCIPSRFNGI